MILKVCGMKYSDNLQELQDLAPDWMGFIFYDRSPRNVVDLPDLSEIKAKRIGVFVNPEEDFLREKVDLFSLDGVQLHGEEPPEFCQALRASGLLVLKSFSVDDDFDFGRTAPYHGNCDYFIFDTKGSQRGGTGQSFDWTLLKRYKGTTPFLLSGGIGPDSVDAIQQFSHPQWKGLDINSRFEVKPGFKNIELIQKFKDAIFG